MKWVVRSTIVAVVFMILNAVAIAQQTLKFMDGSQMQGAVISTNSTEVLFKTDFGILRIAPEKLAAETRSALGLKEDPQQTALLIAELQQQIAKQEQEIESLKIENQSLRQQLKTAQEAPAPASVPTPPSGSQFSGRSGAISSQSVNSTGYSRSNTGKRHNSSCRYYDASKPCGPSDGVACKICGG